MHIVLVGASGFVGQALVRAFSAAGHRCDVLTRQAARRRALRLIPGVRLIETDVYDPVRLRERLAGADAVVSMAGILNEPLTGREGFRRVHVELVQGIVEAGKAAGVGRLLHVSAINSGEGRSRYLLTKGEAETLLLDSGLDVSIYRPSVIFGPGDSFFNRFASLLRLAPVLPLACPEARLQPVFVGDVAQAMCRTLTSHGAQGPVLELAGPKVYSLHQLVQWTAKTLGRRRWVPGLPDALSRLQGRVMDLVPGRPFSTDNYRSLQLDNVTEYNALPELGVEPASVEAVVPTYLGMSPRQQRFMKLRRQGRHGRY